MKETIIKASGSTLEASGVQAQPSKQTEQILDNFANNSIQIINEALADKDKQIRELEAKINHLKTQLESKKLRAKGWINHGK